MLVVLTEHAKARMDERDLGQHLSWTLLTTECKRTLVDHITGFTSISQIVRTTFFV